MPFIQPHLLVNNSATIKTPRNQINTEPPNTNHLHRGTFSTISFIKEIMTQINNFESINIVEIGATMGTYTGEGALLVSVL